MWLPDHEQAILAFADKPGWMYQGHKFVQCLPYLKGKKSAIDIGAHCGLWSKMMLQVFAKVYAFEPLEPHRECLLMNAPNVRMFPYALGAKSGTVKIETPEGSSGDSHVTGDGEIEMRTLDSFHLSADFIKIDCEGYEYFILQGAEKTIKVCKPVIIIEQKPGKATRYGLRDTEGVELLESWGYQVRSIISGDYICVHG